MEKLKIEEKQPLTISYEKMKKIANKIIDRQIDWEYSTSDEYWMITITPSGKIILPTKDTSGHPSMAEKIIYPNDKFLDLLYNYMMDDKNRSNLLMSYFMIQYGYINIDGFSREPRIISCRYNPLALTVHTRALPDSMQKYCEMQSTINEEYSDSETIELSKKVPFFKKKILELLEKNQFSEKEVEKLIEKRGQTTKDFLDDISKTYKLYREEQMEK